MLAVITDIGTNGYNCASSPQFVMASSQHSEASGSEFDLRLKEDEPDEHDSASADGNLAADDCDTELKPVVEHVEHAPRCSSSSSSSRRHHHQHDRRHSAGGSVRGDQVDEVAAEPEATRPHQHSQSARTTINMVDDHASPSDQRLQQCQAEAQRRENILVMRLATKEQEVHDYFTQLEELRSSLGGGLRTSLLDPVVNSMFQKMKHELKDTKLKLEQSQQELSAWKFTPDSSTGKRLMARCRTLMQENEELGKLVEQGRLARLQGELATQTQLTHQLQTGQEEVDELLVELDGDMEGLQTTVMFLQNELDKTRLENGRMRTLLQLGEHESLPDDCTARTAHSLAADIQMQTTAATAHQPDGRPASVNTTAHSTTSSNSDEQLKVAENGYGDREDRILDGDDVPGDEKNSNGRSRSPAAKRSRPDTVQSPLDEEAIDHAEPVKEKRTGGSTPQSMQRASSTHGVANTTSSTSPGLRGRRGRGRRPSSSSGGGAVRGATRSPRKRTGAADQARNGRQYRQHSSNGNTLRRDNAGQGQRRQHKAASGSGGNGNEEMNSVSDE